MHPAINNLIETEAEEAFENGWESDVIINNDVDEEIYVDYEPDEEIIFENTEKKKKKLKVKKKNIE